MDGIRADLSLNRANWDDRVPIHLASPDYDPARFDDPAFLTGVVRFDRPRLGDVARLRGLHLQCHVGADTVSLARLGARMTGVDFSAPAIEAARSLAGRAGVEATFVESDVDHAVEAAGAGAYDLVYTGIGALCWLPDIHRWAGVVAGLLAPGGRLFLREGHPVLWSVDDTRDDALVIGHPYFETVEPMEFDEDTSYVDSTATLTATRTQEWNHGLGEVVGALLAQGLVLTGLEEHRSVPWLALPGLMEPVPDGDGEHRLREHPERLALTYTLQAVKPG
ncbi:class I SAM-dependent methyltransferase [Microlunatus flavus]|uniref:Methyltransferase domain-containing protein n=1 Tax=Microlunatus flavus TaxID=1036181 RepID=A0A1H9GVK4_9ACTN|nr:class I SAM-dependent methyltransferase [Microlunatus flavus]SEQ54132.1 Methyltransferase domain-containing protein [Microlunatus flavus]